MFDTLKEIFAEAFSKRNYTNDIKALFNQSERKEWPTYETNDLSFETHNNIVVEGLTLADIQRRLEQKGIRVSLARIQTIVTDLKEKGVLRSSYTLKNSPVRIYTRGVNF